MYSLLGKGEKKLTRRPLFPYRFDDKVRDGKCGVQEHSSSALRDGKGKKTKLTQYTTVTVWDTLLENSPSNNNKE
jgi:hypothetical protein